MLSKFLISIFCFIIPNNITSLQGSKQMDFVNDYHNKTCKVKHITKSGVCCFPSFCNDGSMSLEAAIVLPMFLFAMISCMMFGQMLMVKGKMHHGLNQAAMEAALSEYKKSRAGSHVGLAEIYVLQKKYADLEDIPSAIKIKNLNFLGTRIPNDLGESEIHMNYGMEMNFPFVGKKEMQIMDVVCQKNYTGYEPTAFELGNGYVYVTKYGQVYHKSLSCSHIMLTINSSGQLAHYRPCSKCIKGKPDPNGTYFLPKEGDCYHSSLGCAGLTRTIRTITVWEIGGLRPCSACGN